MSEVVRSVIMCLRGVFNPHSGPKKRAVCLSLNVSLSDSKLSRSGKLQSCAGHTCELGSKSVSFILPTMRLNDRHIFNEGGAALRVQLELPDCSIDMDIVPVRYDLFKEGETEQGFIICGEIAEMSDAHRTRYDEFLRSPVRGTNVTE